MPALLKLGIFLIVFALTSSIISLFFDRERQHIKNDLELQIQNQNTFRSAYSQLWDEFFKIQTYKTQVSSYADRLLKTDNIKKPQTLLCMFEQFKVYQVEQTTSRILEIGEKFISKKQYENYEIKDIKKHSISALKRIRQQDDPSKPETEQGLYEFCNSLDLDRNSIGLKQSAHNIEKLISLSTELKFELENTIEKKTKRLNATFIKSNQTIFFAFILQLIVFLIISFIDINTSGLRREHDNS